MSDLQTIEQEPENAVATTKAPMTPMEMISAALANGQGVEMVEKLMQLQERWEASQGRREFDQAISAAKAKIPPIKRNKEGHNKKSYADFSAIAKVVDPILAEYGLSYRFRTEQDNLIKVTCILSHSSGHSEASTLCGPSDGSGSKNAIQAIGSTLTYLQRYSLVQALGIAVSDDDDGNAAGMGPTITDDQFNTLQSLIEETGSDVQQFCKHFGIEAVKDMPASKFKTADQLLKQKRSKANG